MSDYKDKGKMSVILSGVYAKKLKKLTEHYLPLKVPKISVLYQALDLLEKHQEKE